MPQAESNAASRCPDKRATGTESWRYRAISQIRVTFFVCVYLRFNCGVLVETGARQDCLVRLSQNEPNRNSSHETLRIEPRRDSRAGRREKL